MISLYNRLRSTQHDHTEERWPYRQTMDITITKSSKIFCGSSEMRKAETDEFIKRAQRPRAFQSGLLALGLCYNLTINPRDMDEHLSYKNSVERDDGVVYCRNGSAFSHGSIRSEKYRNLISKCVTSRDA